MLELGRVQCRNDDNNNKLIPDRKPKQRPDRSKKGSAIVKGRKAQMVRHQRKERDETTVLS